MTIDVEELRKYLMDEVGPAAFGPFPVALMDLIKIENATPEELVEIAIENGVDLSKFEIHSYTKKYPF